MERISQKLLLPIFIRPSGYSDEILTIDQFSNDLKQNVEHHIEKQSIPALIEALKKYQE